MSETKRRRIFENREPSMESRYKNLELNQLQEKIFDLLLEKEMTQTEISNYFNRNIDSYRINKALGTLESNRVVSWYHRAGDGRPVTVWYSMR